MLRLRHSLLSQLLSSSSASTISQLSRLISSTTAPAPAVPPRSGFAVEEYLVSTCGLSRQQAAKASPNLSHLKSSAKPDAVLAFLAGLGLSTADVAALVARDPKFLCAGVERTLSPVLAGLTGLGLSRPQIARLVSVASASFRRRSIVSGLPYFLSIFDSYDNLLRALRRNPRLPDIDLVKPNIVLLNECGLGACDIAKICIFVPRLLTSNRERVHAMVACGEGLGVPRGSGMFRQALQAVAFLDKGKIASKVEFLKKTFRWSDAEVGIAVSKSPVLLGRSNGALQRRSEFLISEVGLEPGYIAYRPVILNYCMDGRLRPRYYVFKFLKENGLLDRGRDFYRAVVISEKEFVENFIAPHKEAAPHLAEDYATTCRGEVPSRFIFA